MLRLPFKKLFRYWTFASVVFLSVVCIQIVFGNDIYTGREKHIILWVVVCIAPVLLVLLYAIFKSKSLGSEITGSRYKILIFFVALYWFFIYATLICRILIDIENYELTSLWLLIPLQLFVFIPLCVSLFKKNELLIETNPLSEPNPESNEVESKPPKEERSKDIQAISKKKEMRIFISYQHKDIKFKEGLVKHLAGLERQKIIQTWNDEDILPGANKVQTIIENLNIADVILLLISSDFIFCDWCYLEEMKMALKRDHNARVIPIIIRPCNWEDTDFAHLQPIPANGKAISTCENQDEAFLNVVAEIKRLI